MIGPWTREQVVAAEFAQIIANLPPGIEHDPLPGDMVPDDSPLSEDEMQQRERRPVV